MVDGCTRYGRSMMMYFCCGGGEDLYLSIIFRCVAVVY